MRGDGSPVPRRQRSSPGRTLVAVGMGVLAVLAVGLSTETGGRGWRFFLWVVISLPVCLGLGLIARHDATRRGDARARRIATGVIVVAGGISVAVLAGVLVLIWILSRIGDLN